MDSLLDLPEEVLHVVIFWLTHGNVRLNSGNLDSQDRPPHTFTPNRCRIQIGYDDLMSLSMTCIRLRSVCGPGLFGFLSLVRQSEIDAILDYPSRLDKWSDSKVFQRAYVTEVLKASFRKCSDAELAKKSFRENVNGDVRWSRYQGFSCNNYVTQLEICNDTLKSGDLVHFPQVRSLRVLDCALTSPTQVKCTFGPHLSSLSINIGSLLRPDLLLWSSRLTRLDTVCDVNDLHPGHSFEVLKQKLASFRLHQLNLFVNDPDVLRYVEFVDFLKFLVAHGTIESLSIRLTRKKGHSAKAPNWDILECNGPAFLDALHSPVLANVMLDYDIISRLLFPEEFHLDNRVGSPVCFSLIDYSLSVPKLLFRPREIVANLIQGVGATEVVFIYGEVIDQAHLHAIGVMSNLLVYLALDAHRPTPYANIGHVSMEKAWSVADDSQVRTHYEKLMDAWEASPKGDARRKLLLEIVLLFRAEPHLFTSPRYRRREHYLVFPQQCVMNEGNPVPIMLPLPQELGKKDSFWTVETSLRDLEHYGVRERVLSSIWD